MRTHDETLEGVAAEIAAILVGKRVPPGITPEEWIRSGKADARAIMLARSRQIRAAAAAWIRAEEHAARVLQAVDGPMPGPVNYGPGRAT